VRSLIWTIVIWLSMLVNSICVTQKLGGLDFSPKPVGAMILMYFVFFFMLDITAIIWRNK